ncbi:MAG: histidine phosphatase family protein [Planctomycetota bacterium]
MTQRRTNDLLLVRCGRTAWDLEGRIQGASDLPLSDAGRTGLIARLRHVVQVHHDIRVGGWISAPDEASLATAQMAAELLGGRVRGEKTLRAMHLGLWEGLSECDCDARFRNGYRAWRSSPLAATPPSSEAIHEVLERLVAGIHKGASKPLRGALGVVLRPFEHALLHCLVHGRDLSTVWEAVETAPRIEFVERGVERLLLPADAPAAG